MEEAADTLTYEEESLHIPGAIPFIRFCFPSWLLPYCRMLSAYHPLRDEAIFQKEEVIP